MASELERLIMNVRAIGKGADQTAANLQSFDRVFSRHIDTVKQTIGGSTRRADLDVIAALEHAQAETEQAAFALQEAARVCEKYASSI